MAQAVNLGAFKWDRDPSKVLLSLVDKIQKQILLRAVTRASTPIRKAAKATAPVRTGALKKSMSTKAKRGRNKNVAFAIIGPRKSFMEVHGTISRGPKKGNPRRVVPRYYAHLVERGHRGPHPAGAKPFLTNAASSAMPKALTVMKEVVGIGIQKALTK